MIRSLETHAGIAAGFQESLLVGFLVSQCAGGEQFPRLKRNFAELHRGVVPVAPLAHVMSPVAHVEDLKAAAARVLLVIIAITPPSA